MSCSKSKMLQHCMDLAEVIRDLRACTNQPPPYDPAVLKQITPKLVSLVAALRSESNALPLPCSAVDASEALKQCVVKFLQQLKSPASTPEAVHSGIIEIALKLKDVADKTKELPDDANAGAATTCTTAPAPVTLTPTKAVTTAKSFVPVQTQPRPMAQAIPSKLASSAGSAKQTPPSPKFLSSSSPTSLSPSRSFMDFPIPVRQVMNQREEVKSTLTSLVQAHKETNMSLCKEMEEKLTNQVNEILALGKNGGCDMSASILPMVEKLCAFSNNIGYSQDLVAVMSDLNLALKDIATTYKNFNKERAKSGGNPAAASGPVPVIPALGGHSGNVQILVNELRGLVQDGDPLDKYNLVKKVGEGASGSVWKAEVKGSQKEAVAIKKVELSVKTIEGTLKEIRFMSDIHHPNALEYRECWLPKGEVWIVMEFCDGGSVSDILEKLAVPLEEKCISAITAQTLDGLEYLHSKQKIHRDIKAANLLLTIEGRVKIADFGTSAEGSARTTVVGTFMWMAPETIDARGHDSKADIWSLGITLVEMAELYPPYWHLRTQPRQVAQAILREASPTLKQLGIWTPEFAEVVNLCLQKDPTRRPTASMLQKHPFMANPDPTCIVELLKRLNEAKQAGKPASQPQQQPATPLAMPIKSPLLAVAEKSMNRPSKTLPRQSGKYRSGAGTGQLAQEGSPSKEIPVTITLSSDLVGRKIPISSTMTAAQLAQKCAVEFQDAKIPESEYRNFCLYFIGVSTSAGSEFKIPEQGVVWSILQAIWSKNPEVEPRFLWK